MKKVFAMLIMVFVLCSLLVIPTQAAGNGSLSMSSASGKRGDTVTLSVKLNSNPGLVTMTIRVSYDTSVLKLTSVSNPGLLVGAQLNTSYGSPYTISWVDGATTTNNTKTGTIATFTFKILDNAKVGDSKVTLQFIDSYDTDYNENSFSATSGKVTVTCQHNYGNWANVDDTNHGKTCSICQNVQKEAHKWDKGTTIKQANCKEGGQIKYTCTTCSATKTVDTNKTNDHKYGDWTNASATQHKHTCTVCSKEETANHTWGNGVVTTKPNCKDTGVMTYTCACGATKTEDIDKTNDHTYGSWTKVDDTTHKHTCTVCSKEETANHTWGSGVVTTKPNCKDTGVKTYTCACGATKTEDIDKTNDHKYGKWTDIGDGNHKHICSVCSKEETAVHTWNKGAVTKPASCKEIGTKTFTCTGCGLTRTEDIPMLTTHKYDHGCDKDCNVCGAVRTTSHKYKTSWSKDKSGHWHECSECKDKKDFSAHKPGAAATETKAQTCTTCGYVITAALGHKHNYSTDWTTNEAGHWHACSGCATQDSYAAHSFENDCDTDCSVCGYVRTAGHTYKTEWSSDGEKHWHECTGCGLKADEGEHIPGAAATETTAQTCTTCGYELAPKLEPAPTTAPAGSQDNSNNNTDNVVLVVVAIVAGVAAIGGGAAFTVIKKKK